MTTGGSTVEYATSPAGLRCAAPAGATRAGAWRPAAGGGSSRPAHPKTSGTVGCHVCAHGVLQVGLAYFDLQDLAHACAALAAANATPATGRRVAEPDRLQHRAVPSRAARAGTAASSASMSPPPAAAGAAARDSARRSADRLARSKADSAASHKTPAATTKRPKANSPSAVRPLARHTACRNTSLAGCRTTGHATGHTTGHTGCDPVRHAAFRDSVHGAGGRVSRARRRSLWRRIFATAGMRPGCSERPRRSGSGSGATRPKRPPMPSSAR